MKKKLKNILNNIKEDILFYKQKIFANLKEDILFYIINWYSNSWFYYNVICKMREFENDINNKSHNIEHAKWLCTRKRFKFVPKSFKQKCIYNKFGIKI